MFTRNFSFSFGLALHWVLLVAQCSGEFILNSPAVTNFGTWEPNWTDCPPETFVKSMLYTPGEEALPPPNEDQPDGHDDKGLDSIVLECASPYDPAGTPTTVIVSPGSTTKGTLQTPLAMETAACEGFAIGFQLLSDDPQIALDNTGANNMRLYCSGLKDSPTQYVEGYGDYTGEWSDAQYCKSRQAICGIRSQVQMTAGSDDSGINNVRMKCCDIPSPASKCSPSDRWEMVQECDNLNGTTPIQCTFYRTVGLGTNTNFDPPQSGRSLVEEYYQNAALGFDIGTGYTETPFWLMYDLSTTFKEQLAFSVDTGHNWTTVTNEVWNAESSTVIHFEVKEGYRAEIYQLVGSCSHYSVKTPRLRKVDKSRYQSF